MPKIKEPIFNQKMNEYFFHIFSNLSDEQKRHLSNAELNIINDKAKLRAFTQGGFLEKKLVMLTKINLQWHLVMYQNDGDVNELAAKVVDQHKRQRLRVENIEQAWSKKVFVLNNKQSALALALMGENGATRFINGDFMRLSNKASFINNQFKINALNPEYIRSEGAFHSVSQIMFHSILSDNFIKAEGLQMLDFLILQVVFKNPNKYYHLDTVEAALDPNYSARAVQLHCISLFNEGYLERLPNGKRRPIYTITAKGIMTLSRVVARVVNLTENF